MRSQGTATTRPCCGVTRDGSFFSGWVDVCLVLSSPPPLPSIQFVHYMTCILVPTSQSSIHAAVVKPLTPSLTSLLSPPFSTCHICAQVGMCPVAGLDQVQSSVSGPGTIQGANKVTPLTLSSTNIYPITSASGPGTIQSAPLDHH